MPTYKRSQIFASCGVAPCRPLEGMWVEATSTFASHLRPSFILISIGLNWTGDRFLHETAVVVKERKTDGQVEKEREGFSCLLRPAHLGHLSLIHCYFCAALLFTHNFIYSGSRRHSGGVSQLPMHYWRGRRLPLMAPISTASPPHLPFLPLSYYFFYLLFPTLFISFFSLPLFPCLFFLTSHHCLLL